MPPFRPAHDDIHAQHRGCWRRVGTPVSLKKDDLRGVALCKALCVDELAVESAQRCAMSDSGVSASSTARVLVMVEQPLLVEVIKLTLNHGVFVTREVKSVSDATAVLESWNPHLSRRW